MKSEERHKLHQNVLAVRIAQTITTIKPYQNFILGGVIVAILAVIVVAWRNSESTAQASRSWTQLFTAISEGNPAALQKVAGDNPRSYAAPAADLLAADILLAQGCNLLFINRATANQALNKAVELYQKVREQNKSPALRAQAAFGVARAYESQGKLEAAVKVYAEVTADWPDTVFAQMSQQRLEDLKRDFTRAMYDQFALYDPKPVFSQPPGEKPDFDKLPEESPIFTPGTLDERGIEEKQEQKADIKVEDNKPDEKTEKPADAQPSTGADKAIPEKAAATNSSPSGTATDAQPAK